MKRPEYKLYQDGEEFATLTEGCWMCEHFAEGDRTPRCEGCDYKDPEGADHNFELCKGVVLRDE